MEQKKNVKNFFKKKSNIDVILKLKKKNQISIELINVFLDFESLQVLSFFRFASCDSVLLTTVYKLMTVQFLVRYLYSSPSGNILNHSQSLFIF